MLTAEDEIYYVCLTFEEANILIENYRKQDHAGMIARLDNLLQNTRDQQLQSELCSLLKKIQNLTPPEYSSLAEDIESGTIVFPPNYSLPFMS